MKHTAGVYLGQHIFYPYVNYRSVSTFHSPWQPLPPSFWRLSSASVDQNERELKILFRFWFSNLKGNIALNNCRTRSKYCPAFNSKVSHFILFKFAYQWSWIWVFYSPHISPSSWSFAPCVGHTLLWEEPSHCERNKGKYVVSGQKQANYLLSYGLESAEIWQIQ